MKMGKLKKLVSAATAAAVLLCNTVSGIAYDYPKPVPDISELSQSEALIAVCESQLGYAGDDENKTFYSEWANQSGRPWCSEFISWCAFTAGISDIVPKGLSSGKFREKFAQMGSFYIPNTSKDHVKCGCAEYAVGTLDVSEIKRGDILIFDTNSNFADGPDHSALCLYVEGNTLYTIDGNMGGKVKLKERSVDKLHGICRPLYTSTEHFHSYTLADGKFATCVEKGYALFKCSCGDRYELISDEVGHEFDSATYTWSSDNKTCTASLECVNCDYVITETATATAMTTAATCSSEGVTVYTAAFADKNFETQQNNVTLPTLPHDYGDPVYTWSGSNSYCTARRDCTVCGFSETEETTTSLDVTESYLTKGKNVYTAEFENEAFPTTTATTAIAKKVLNLPSSLKISASNSVSATLEWSKVSDADGYSIEKYNSAKKTWKVVKTISSPNTTKYKAAGLKSGAATKFRIRAFVKESGKKAYSQYRSITATTNPTKAANVRVSRTDAGSVTLEWNRNTTASGYEIRQKVNGKWRTVKEISGNKNTSVTISALDRGTSYKFRVRTYKKVGSEKYYGGNVNVTGQTTMI